MNMAKARTVRDFHTSGKPVKAEKGRPFISFFRIYSSTVSCTRKWGQLSLQEIAQKSPVMNCRLEKKSRNSWICHQLLFDCRPFERYAVIISNIFYLYLSQLENLRLFSMKDCSQLVEIFVITQIFLYIF